MNTSKKGFYLTRAIELRSTARKMLDLRENQSLPFQVRYRAAVMRDYSLDCAAEFERLARECKDEGS